jgi:hypothetical protein
VSGGAGAHAYPIERAPGDPFQSKAVNYHYLQVEVDRGKVKVTMHRLDLTSGTPLWTEPDSVTISAPAAKAVAQQIDGRKGRAVVQFESAPVASFAIPLRILCVLYV